MGLIMHAILMLLSHIYQLRRLIASDLPKSADLLLLSLLSSCSEDAPSLYSVNIESGRDTEIDYDLADFLPYNYNQVDVARNIKFSSSFSRISRLDLLTTTSLIIIPSGVVALSLRVSLAEESSWSALTSLLVHSSTLQKLDTDARSATVLP